MAAILHTQIHTQTHTHSCTQSRNCCESLPISCVSHAHGLHVILQRACPVQHTVLQKPFFRSYSGEEAHWVLRSSSPTVVQRAVQSSVHLHSWASPVRLVQLLQFMMHHCTRLEQSYSRRCDAASVVRLPSCAHIHLPKVCNTKCHAVSSCEGFLASPNILCPVIYKGRVLPPLAPTPAGYLSLHVLSTSFVHIATCSECV